MLRIRLPVGYFFPAADDHLTPILRYVTNWLLGRRAGVLRGRNSTVFFELMEAASEGDGNSLLRTRFALGAHGLLGAVECGEWF